jgi:hypothetical protein
VKARAFGAAMACLVSAGGAARADGGPPASRASIDGDMHGYYGGERVAAYVIGGMGAAAAGAGGYLATRDGDLARSLGWSWLVTGGLELLGATFYAVQVGGEIDLYERALERDPAGYRAEELDHLRGTSSRFVFYRAFELGLTLAGAGMAGYGFATGRDAWKGAGIGVGSLALPLFVVDSFNDARATRYRGEVQRFAPAVGLAPNGVAGGWSVSLSGRF